MHVVYIHLPWLGVDFGSWCYKTFVFWLRGMSVSPERRLDRPCRWHDGRNRLISRPNGRPVDHKCWLISTGRAKCHYPRAKCDWVAQVKLFWVAGNRNKTHVIFTSFLMRPERVWYAFCMVFKVILQILITLHYAKMHHRNSKDLKKSWNTILLTIFFS